MFQSFGRGFRMILASAKMGFQDKRLLIPSLLTVFINFFFAIILMVAARDKMQGTAQGFTAGLSQAPHELLKHGHAGAMTGLTSLNGAMDQGGFGAMGALVNWDTGTLVFCVGVVWWLTDKFLEGVTTALVYSHLVEGPKSGKFSTACQAVLASLPAIFMLGVATFIAKKLCAWMKNKRNSGVFGFGVNLLSNVIEIFWTLAGHLILPAIVIEGTSFWGALKRADRIAQGNLLTIGVGEVGVDAISKAVTYGVYLLGVAGFGGAFYLYSQNAPISIPVILAGGLAWAGLVVLTNAAFLYIRAAFYTCLYVWAIEAEAVDEAERVQVSAPAPLAEALA